MSRLTERLARQPQLTTSNEPAAAPDERAPVGIQPRGPDLAAAETQYAACRTAWLEALRASRSGSNAALARLALAQTAYEASTAALEQARIEDAAQQERLAAFRERREEARRRAEAIAEQTVAWSRVRETKPAPTGLLGRLFRRR
ncbi:MAG TPA: hypothetical protein VFQ81_09635 [Candidatus Limnocylindria bacterium]|nr:hypothetical protein [Candidatus Limnocylindria bacterium]